MKLLIFIFFDSTGGILNISFFLHKNYLNNKINIKYKKKYFLIIIKIFAKWENIFAKCQIRNYHFLFSNYKI